MKFYISSNGEDDVCSSCIYICVPLLDNASGCKGNVCIFKGVLLGFLKLQMMCGRKSFLFLPVTSTLLITYATDILFRKCKYICILLV